MSAWSRVLRLLTLPRLVRDLSRKSGKQCGTHHRRRRDRAGQERGRGNRRSPGPPDPNSVDHGLEPEEERIDIGKKPKGTVWLRAYHKGNSVAIEVEDDGRGIDAEKCATWPSKRASSLGRGQGPGRPRGRGTHFRPGILLGRKGHGHLRPGRGHGRGSATTSRISRETSTSPRSWARAPSSP